MMYSAGRFANKRSSEKFSAPPALLLILSLMLAVKVDSFYR